MKPTAADERGDGSRVGIVMPVGREVSCRPIGFFFRRVRSQGHSPELLLEGIERSEKRLTDPHERVDWESFRRLMANLGRIWSDEQFVEAGKDLAVSPWVQPFGSIARLLLSCDELYRWNFHPRAGVARQMLTCIENEMREVGEGRIVVDATMAPGYEPSRELLVLLKGTLMTMPRVLALGEARVEMEPIAEGMRYTVDYPIHISAFARLRRTLARPFAARTAARELQEASEDLFERWSQLTSETVGRASAEQALVESESRFYKAFHSAPLMMTISTLDGRMVEANERFLETVGYRYDEVAGRDVRDLDIWGEPEARARMVDALRRGEAVRGVETTIRTRSGEQLVGLISGERITVEGEPCVIFQALDVTDRKRAEEENRRLQERVMMAQKLESLGVMAGGIAHDFNNLLVGILGNAELALKGLGDADRPVRERLEAVQNASKRAADLTRAMLAYAGKARLETAPLDLVGLVDETAVLVRSGLSKRTTLQWDTGEGPTWVEGDEGQIRRVIMNLLTNASEAYGERDGVVQVRCGITDLDRETLAESYLGDDLPGGTYAYVEVRDHGDGMDADTQRRIFDPFFTTKFTGRGLGLAAVLGIVRSHRGALRVRSTPDAGTVFQVLLPRVEAPASPGVDHGPGTAEWAAGESVLVVDDEESVREVAQLMLEKAGFKAVCAENGERAVELLRRDGSRIAVALLDMTMPGMSGEETFRALRRLRPELPVVCCSGYGDTAGARWIAGKSQVTFLAKPFTADGILQELRRLLPRAAGEPRA